MSLTVFTSVIVLRLFRFNSCSLYMVFDVISSNIEEVLSINPSANVFAFGDLNFHHKDWLIYSGGTERPLIELCYNFSVSNDLTEMANFPTQIPDCDSCNAALLDLVFLLILAFAPQWLSLDLGNSDHAGVTVSIDFLSNSKQDPVFHCIACDYCCADWDCLHYHLRDVTW